jgi:N utilization substance protein B
MTMSTARDLRRCALQALYQFDAGNVDRPEWVRESLEGSAGSEQTHQAGFDLALGAWEIREEADATLSALTPDWPTYRQPVIDRSILRMAYYEIVTETAPPKVVINEAVELAKEFSTEKSPLFINGVLDKFYRSRVEPPGAEEEPGHHDVADAPRPNDEATCSR